MAFNLPALWRATKFYEFNYPIQNVAVAQGTKGIQIDLKKYLTGDTDFLGRVFVRIHGPIVKAGAGVGVATGKDNPRGLFVSANLSTAPIYGNASPLNAVSQRAFDLDAALVGDADIGSAALTDAAETVQYDQVYCIRFKQPDSRIVQGVGYDLALGRYNSLTLNLLFGGRDQLFSGGTNTWNLSGLTVELYADIDVGIQPDYIHAVEMFENNYAINATTGDFKIDNLPGGFIYSDLFIVAEEANVPSAGILNNIALSNGAQTWLSKGEGNAEFVRRRGQAFSGYANALVGAGLYPLPLHDGMFTRGVDCRNSPPLISLDVTAGAATNIRLFGRKMIPGGIYANPNKNKKAA